MGGLCPASLSQAGWTHRHHHCACVAHPAHLSSDQWPEKQVCGLGVPSKHFISSKDEWLSIHPLISLQPPAAIACVKLTGLMPLCKDQRQADTVFWRQVRPPTGPRALPRPHQMLEQMNSTRLGLHSPQCGEKREAGPEREQAGCGGRA